MYIVYNAKTEEIKGRYKSKKSARNRRDKLDNEYGGYIYAIKENGILVF